MFLSLWIIRISLANDKIHNPQALISLTKNPKNYYIWSEQMDENECRMCRSMLFSNFILFFAHTLSNACMCAVVYRRTSRRDEKTFIVEVYARIFLFLYDFTTHSNNGFLVFLLLLWLRQCVGVPFSTHTHTAHTMFECHLVCNPCSIYCMLSFPFHADTILLSLFFFNWLSASQYYSSSIYTYNKIEKRACSITIRRV